MRTLLPLAAWACQTGSSTADADRARDPFAVVALADSLAHRELWPGFDPRTTPVAVFDGARTLLFRHPAPPATFIPLPDHPGVLVHDGRDSSVSANTNAELGGIPTATLMPPGDSTTGLARAGILLHETFHVFQRAHHPDWSANEADLFTYPVSDAGLLGLRRLESEALRRALAAESPGCWTGRAIRLRKQRFAQLGGDGATYERQTELNEGLATYVERRATGAADSSIMPAAGFPAEAVRQRAYRSGVAMARLLDRLSPGWRTALEQRDSIPLDSMLSVVVSSADTSACAFRADERNRITRTARQDQQELVHELQDRRRTFLEQPGWRLTIEAGSPLFPQGFDPLNVQVVAPGEVLHTRFLRLGNSSGSIEIMGRPALTASAGAHPLFTGVRTLTLTGLKAPPTVVASDSGLTVSADGIAATWHSADVDTAGMAVTVRLPGMR